MDRALQKAMHFEKATDEIKEDYAIKEMALKYEIEMEKRQASKVKEILESKVVTLMTLVKQLQEQIDQQKNTVTASADNNSKFIDTIKSMSRSLALSNYETEKAQSLNLDYEATTVSYQEYMKVLSQRDVALNSVKFQESVLSAKDEEIQLLKTSLRTLARQIEAATRTIQL